MSVSFLYPLFWLGALAVAVPVWLHLRRKEESNLVHFSAMRFLEDQPIARRRPLWPRDWPLLLLRLLALLLLVTAFAWPYLPQHDQVVVRESRVYILDNTLSHQRASGFTQSRDRIAKALQAAGIETQIAVVELTSAPRVVVSFGDEKQQAASRVRDLQPSFQRGSYLAAFRIAAGLLEQSLGYERKMVLLGDSQANQWNESLQSPPFLEDDTIELPELAVESVANLALMEPRVRRVFVGNDVFVECEFRLYRQGEIDQATVVIDANGEEIVRREISLPENAESITLTHVWKTNPEHWLCGRVRLVDEPDELAADDSVVFSLPPVREGRLGLMTDSKYLRTALSPEVMRGRWRRQLLNASSIAESSSDDRSDFDVLCLESQFLSSTSVRELVLDSLNDGRGVVLLVDRVTPVISSFLRQLGVVSGERPDVRQAGDGPGFRYVFMDHPVFAAYRSTDFGNVMDIAIHRYRPLEVSNAIPLAFSQRGDPLVFESTKTTGKLLIFAFTMDRRETNWPLDPTFVPFLDKCLQYVRSQPEVQTAYLPGETFIWKIPAQSDAANLVLRRIEPTQRITTVVEAAAGKSTARSTDVHPVIQNAEARFLVPDKPGHYELVYDNAPEILTVLDVNPPTEESKLEFLDGKEFVDAWRQETTTTSSSRQEDSLALELSKIEILRQHVWWWLLLLGLAAAVIETVWVSLKRTPA